MTVNWIHKSAHPSFSPTLLSGTLGFFRKGRFGVASPDALGNAMSERIETYEDFWPFYLSEHRDARSRRLHFVGTSAWLTSLAASTALNPIAFPASKETARRPLSTQCGPSRAISACGS